MKSRRWWVVLLCGVMLAWPARAQDDQGTKPADEGETPKAEAPKATPKKVYEEPPLKRWGGVELQVGAWNADFAGADYRAAAVYQSGRQGIVSQILELPTDPVVRTTVLARWLLPKDRGRVEFAWDSIRHSSSLQKFNPGIFQYGEIQADPPFAGLAYNGLADGVRSRSLTKSRRFRLEYSAKAFETARSRGYWHAGIQSADYSRHFETYYYAIAPNLPPTIPPIFNASGVSPLTPRADIAVSDSTFSGLGPAAGMDFVYEIAPRVSVVAGFSLGIFDGKMDTKYTSITHAYYYNGFLSYSELLAALDDPEIGPSVSQVDFPLNLAQRNAGHVAEDFEAYLGVEGRVWHTLHVYARYRGLVLANVAADARPTDALYYADSAVTVTGVSQETRSAGYLGFEAGLSFRY